MLRDYSQLHCSSPINSRTDVKTLGEGLVEGAADLGTKPGKRLQLTPFINPQRRSTEYRRPVAVSINELLCDYSMGELFDQGDSRRITR